MAAATTVSEYLSRHHVPFDILEHERTVSSVRTAEATSISRDRLAKGVLLKAEGNYVLAVLPSDCAVKLGELRRQLHCPVSMATADEVRVIFEDCEPGAVPPLGPAYGLMTIWDEQIARTPDLYFEAGDHEHLVHLRTRDYLSLLRDCASGSFTEPM